LTKPVPKVYATRFFQLVTSRQFAEAERILERVRQKMHVSERNRGYFQALYGMLLTQKNNDDRYAFLSSIDPTNKKQLKNHRQEFLSHVDSRLHAEYDRGFFEAWADYMKVLPRLEASALPANKSAAEVEKEKEATTEIKAEAQEETTDKITREEKESIKQETRIEKEEAPTEEKAELERVEPRQSTLFDFAR